MAKQTSETRLAKSTAFEMQRLHRSQIRNAEYNPRQIDKHARKKLEENLRSRGLLQPLVWNSRTGNLVSGHQRLSVIDDLEKDADYALDIAVVDLDEKQEREQNIFFNNPSAQGSWDLNLLSDVLREGVDLTKTGFDAMDVQLMFDDSDFAPMFDLDKQPVEVRTEVEKLKEIDKMKDIRKEYRKDQVEEDDSEFYAVVVFPNRESQSAFMQRCGVDKNDRYLDGIRLHSLLDITKGRDKPLPADLVDLIFTVSKGQNSTINNELRRIGRLLTGKNIQAKALEYMAMNSSQTPIENLTGEAPPEPAVSTRDKIRKRHVDSASVIAHE